MKPIRFSKFMGPSRTLRSFRLALAAPAVALTFASAQAGGPAAPAAAAEPAVASNWISFTIGGAFVNDNDAGMHTRTQTNGDFYGGIDSLQFSKALNSSTTLTLDGHALPGLEDYEGNLTLTKADVGYVKAGYKQFRTWYDGSGGFLAGQTYIPSADDDMTIDRGELSFEAGLRMEKMPEITFSYKHAFRNGQKDSLAWGDSKNSSAYKIAPAMWDIDEKSDTFELDVEHTLGNTDLGMGLMYEHASYSNSRVNQRGFSTAVTTPATTSADAYRIATQTDDWSMNLFAGNLHSVTRFNDQLWLTAGFAYNTVDTDTKGGSRSFEYDYSVYKGTRGGDQFYNNMNGGGQVEQIIGNLNLMYAPMPDLTITPSLRYEHEDLNSWSRIHSYNVVTPASIGNPAYSADSSKDSTIGALDIRYTGLTDWVFYARGQWGREDETVTRNNMDPLNADWLHSDIQIDEQEYSLGANWYPMSGLSFAVQGLYAQRDQSLDHTASNVVPGVGADPVSQQTMRPIMADHDTTIDDFNMRVTWRPASNVSLVTRYDYCQTEYSNQGITWSASSGTSLTNPALYTIAEIESGEVTSHIISESVTWNPMARLYVQGSASYVWSETETGEKYTGNSDNDYFSGSLTVGYAIDDVTDLTATYTYYGASNYVPSQNYYGANTMGYGLNSQEHSLSLTLTRALTPSMIWNLRYGFITSQTDPQPDQTGGFNDFTAQMISTGLQIRF